MTRRDPTPRQEKHVGPLEVRASDIGKSITIVGRLNHPLGQEITIRGEWMWPSDDDSEVTKLAEPSFAAVEVNGNRLAEPVVFLPYLVSELVPGSFAKITPPREHGSYAA